jgi:hypothetical protein
MVVDGLLPLGLFVAVEIASCTIIDFVDCIPVMFAVGSVGAAASQDDAW